MKIRYKLLLGVGSMVALFAVVGFFGLMANQLIIRSIEGDYRQLRNMVSAATAISSLVKRAEAHFLLYLALHDRKDLETYRERLAQLKEQIQRLEKDIQHVGARELLESIRLGYERFALYADSLLVVHAQEVRAPDKFDVVRYRDYLRKVNEEAARIRSLGGQLAKLETDFLNRQEAISAANEVSSYVKRAEGHLLLYLLAHDEKDRQKFYARSESLQEQIQLLQGRVTDFRSRERLQELKAHAAALVPAGEELLLLYDREMAAKGLFAPEAHKERFWQFHEVVSVIREDGEKMTALNTDLEVERERLVRARALENRQYLLAAVAAAIGLVLLLGRYLSRTIIIPINELRAAVRRVKEGDLKVVLKARGLDELGELTNDFQQMTEVLRTTTISKNYLDGIISSMAEGLMVIGRDGAVRTVNRAMCDMLALAEEEIRHASLHDFKPFAGPAREKWLSEELARTEFQNVEDILLTADGRQVPVLLSIKPVRDLQGSFLGVVCVVQDISRIKEAEAEMVKAEVKRVTAAAASLAAVGELTSRIVHEMRNPLASIQVNIEALRGRVEGDPIYAELADISIQQAERLAQMLADLLQYGKPIALRLQPLPAGKLLEDSLLAVRGLAEKKASASMWTMAGRRWRSRWTRS